MLCLFLASPPLFIPLTSAISSAPQVLLTWLYHRTAHSALWLHMFVPVFFIRWWNLRAQWSFMNQWCILSALHGAGFVRRCSVSVCSEWTSKCLGRQTSGTSRLEGARATQRERRHDNVCGASGCWRLRKGGLGMAERKHEMAASRKYWGTILHNK